MGCVDVPVVPSLTPVRRPARGLSVLLVSLFVLCSILGTRPVWALSWTSTTWTIANALTSGEYQPQIPSGSLSPNFSGNYCQIEDFTGTGLPGYICPYVISTSTPAVAGFLSGTNSQSGLTQSALLSGAPSTIDYHAPLPSCYPGNFDGDGRKSLSCVVVSGAYSYKSNNIIYDVPANNYIGWYHGSTYQQFSNATTHAFGSVPIAADYSKIDGCLVLNINGSSRDDIACSVFSETYNSQLGIYQYAGENAAYIYVSTTSGFVQSPLVLGSVVAGQSYLSACLVGDFNGDGLSDFACAPTSGTQWQVFYSEGIGNAPHFHAVTATGPAWVPSVWKVAPVVVADDCLSGDFNGDGLSDIACYNSSGQWNVALSTGNPSTPFKVQSWTGGPTPLLASPHTVATDCWASALDGGKINGIFCYSGSGGTWSYGIWQGGTSTAFQTSNVITSFTPPPESLGYTVTTVCALTDFNGDGLPDIACPDQTHGNKVDMMLSVRPP